MENWLERIPLAQFRACSNHRDILQIDEGIFRANRDINKNILKNKLVTTEVLKEHVKKIFVQIFTN